MEWTKLDSHKKGVTYAFVQTFLERLTVLFKIIVNCMTRECLLRSKWRQGMRATRVGDTRDGNWGCHPSIFSWKKNLATFLCHPPPGCHPTPFYLSDLVSPLFFVNLPTNIFFLRVSPTAGCHPGRSPQWRHCALLYASVTILCIKLFKLCIAVWWYEIGLFWQVGLQLWTTLYSYATFR